MELPRYFIVGDRPVKLARTPDGGMDVLAYDWATGNFQRDLSYLSRVLTGDTEVDEVDEREFETHVERLRRG